MKKFLLITIILLLTTACSSGYLKKLDYNGLKKKLDNKETFVLYLTDGSDIGDALNYNLQKIAKDNKKEFFYLNTEKLSDDDEKKLKELYTFEDSNIIIFVKKGIENSVLSRITDPFISKEELAEELATQGYLNYAEDTNK